MAIAPLWGILSRPAVPAAGRGAGRLAQGLATMQLRWVIAIALWTILSGPIFGPSPSPTAPEGPRAAASKPPSAPR
ncbi:MAG TPA: hypothetical protein VNK04_20880 [Gemmataceae bacterium]|nr:hypothetical protein [Gemmataceae bacterium]